MRAGLATFILRLHAAYAPSPELSRFAVDEITSAALLEKSVVLPEHNRVAPPLDVAQ